MVRRYASHFNKDIRAKIRSKISTQKYFLIFHFCSYTSSQKCLSCQTTSHTSASYIYKRHTILVSFVNLFFFCFLYFFFFSYFSKRLQSTKMSLDEVSNVGSREESKTVQKGGEGGREEREGGEGEREEGKGGEARRENKRIWHLLNLSVVELLEFTEGADVLVGHEVNGDTLATETSATSNSVNVVLQVTWQVVVDHE